VNRRREASLARSRGEPPGDWPDPASGGEGQARPRYRLIGSWEPWRVPGTWEPSWEPSALDPAGSLWTPVDSKARRTGLCGRAWTPVDTDWRSTDQEFGCSSRPGRASEIRQSSGRFHVAVLVEVGRPLGSHSSDWTSSMRETPRQLTRRTCADPGRFLRYERLQASNLRPLSPLGGVRSWLPPVSTPPPEPVRRGL
jgi:hypothetical protein